jgi:hypothetical protein
VCGPATADAVVVAVRVLGAAARRRAAHLTVMPGRVNMPGVLTMI